MLVILQQVASGAAVDGMFPHDMRSSLLIGSHTGCEGRVPQRGRGRVGRSKQRQG